MPLEYKSTLHRLQCSAICLKVSSAEASIPKESRGEVGWGGDEIRVG